jgi:RNA polymerase sigma-70 factor, ECF subfamily
MASNDVHEVTEILRDWRRGADDAAEKLFPLVYQELKRRARNYLSHERRDHTLQPTALVHEAYLRMVDQTSPQLEDRAHFYAIASRVMRQILVDHARKHNAEKRGGRSAARYRIDDLELHLETKGPDLVELNEVLRNFERLDPRKGRVVEMRFFGGMKVSEIAEVLGVTEKTVRRDWQFAKLWLYRELST